MITSSFNKVSKLGVADLSYAFHSAFVPDNKIWTGA